MKKTYLLCDVIEYHATMHYSRERKEIDERYSTINVVLSNCFPALSRFMYINRIYYQKPTTKDMELKDAFAGTLESGDILIQISPAEDKGLHIDLDSTVDYQFGAQIRKVISETLTGLGITDADVKATDKGALDCTIRARATAAAVRATGKDVWKEN